MSALLDVLTKIYLIYPSHYYTRSILPNSILYYADPHVVSEEILNLSTYTKVTFYFIVRHSFNAS